MLVNLPEKLVIWERVLFLGKDKKVGEMKRETRVGIRNKGEGFV